MLWTTDVSRDCECYSFSWKPFLMFFWNRNVFSRKAQQNWWTLPATSTISENIYFVNYFLSTWRKCNSTSISKVFQVSFIFKTCRRWLFTNFFLSKMYTNEALLLKPGPGPWTWTRTLKNLDPEKPGLWKTWILKNVDPEIHESWKTWNKYGIKKYVWLENYAL